MMNCGCNNGCCNQCNVCQELRCYCSRYIDVPMNIYYGEGYTEEDSLRAIQRDISDMACTLRGICRRI